MAFIPNQHPRRLRPRFRYRRDFLCEMRISERFVEVVGWVCVLAGLRGGVCLGKGQLLSNTRKVEMGGGGD
jgi:hypothetical protein